VRQTIRARIALFSFAIFLGLIGLETGLALRGLDRALLEVADRDLADELAELAADVVDGDLAELRELASDPATNTSDLAFEVRDGLERRHDAGPEGLLYAIRRAADRHLLAQSEALGPEGFGTSGTAVQRGALSFRTAPDPREGRAGESLRLARLDFGPYQLELARSLRSFSALYRGTRARLLAIFAVVSVAGGAGAYWIARRALQPVRDLIGEAQRLRTLSEGALPATGRRDEIDDLAGVLNELLARVRADVLRIRRFTADAAHELRTPLAAVRGHLELLLAKVDADAQLTLGGVLEEVERLAKLVDQLLLLEKLQASPETGVRVRLDLGALVDDLVEHLRVLAEERGIELSSRSERALVMGDPEKLRQVFVNLIDNALKFTPAGGRIEVAVGTHASRVRASVRDGGPGVPPEDAERIFERFASDRSRRAAGTGLGLTIARAIARAHAGELRLGASERAEFVLELPAAP